MLMNEKLLRRVRTVSPRAAEQIESEEFKVHISQEAERLSGAFVWSDTPQGVAYWRRLHNLLCRSGEEDNRI